ncbi:MAG: ZIP family metal transporter [Bacillota bacterium]|jgi:ZIP family zinc transporter
MVFDWNLVWSSLCSGLFIVLGTLIALCLKRISHKTLAVILGFAAGIMLAMSTFDLLPVALECGTIFHCGAGIVLGVLFMLLIDKCFFSHHHFKNQSVDENYLKIGLFIAASVALHNLPEGFALGAGYEVAPELGLVFALAIALHNVPEGISIGAPLKLAKLNSFYIVLISLAVGLFTLLGTFVSFCFANMSGGFLSASMGFSAGSMLYIVSDELIPEAHKSHSTLANIGFFLGFLLMFGITYLG